MKRFAVFVVSAMLISCDYFEKKKIDTESILQEELKSINWNDVDEYPTFALCDSVENKKNCFEAVVREALNKKLAGQNIVVTEDVSDTILLKLHIDNLGVLTLKNIEMTAMTRTQIPHLDSLLAHGFDSLPKIFPAIKRGQQVATEFQLPVVIKIH